MEDLQKLCNKVESVIARLGPDTAPRNTMAPKAPTGVLYEEDDTDLMTEARSGEQPQPQENTVVNKDEIKSSTTEESSKTSSSSKSPRQQYRMRIVWRNVILLAYLHLAALYGVYLVFTSAKLLTSIYAFFLYQIGGLGITAGAHRLWAHRAYKAKWPLRLILAIFNLVSFQNHIYEWARDHRVHHKYSETDADPHNATRGFFFAHVGWLVVRKHPQVFEKGGQISLQDLHDDKIVMFQKKYYLILMPLMCFILPTMVPPLLWNESWVNSIMVATLLRYAVTLNVTWLVNSAAHMWGNKPYDKTINPSENTPVAMLALGEGWHNYHHVFPWDYKTAELGNYRYNLTTAFIDFFKWVGWAYDLKTVPQNVVQKRVHRTGDGSHDRWGWGDTDMTQEEKECITRIAPDKSE